MEHLCCGFLLLALSIFNTSSEDHARTVSLIVSIVWQKTSDSLLGLQVGMGALLAATIAVTSPMAYAAPFDTDTGLAPLGSSHPQSGIHITTNHMSAFWALAVSPNN